MINEYFVRHANIWGAFQKKQISNRAREEELQMLRDGLFEDQNPDHKRVIRERKPTAEELFRMYMEDSREEA